MKDRGKSNESSHACQEQMDHAMNFLWISNVTKKNRFGET